MSFQDQASPPGPARKRGARWFVGIQQAPRTETSSPGSCPGSDSREHSAGTVSQIHDVPGLARSRRRRLGQCARTDLGSGVRGRRAGGSQKGSPAVVLGAHERPGVRGIEHLVAAEIDPDVIDMVGVGTEEHQIPHEQSLQ